MGYERVNTERDDFWRKFGDDAPRFSRGLRVMEIGCGTGSRSFEIASHGAQVLGIDPSAVMIESAEQERQKLEPKLAERVSFRQCTIQDVESDDFDIVISEDSFEHIVDVPDVLAAIRDKLAPGGRAYIGFGPLYHSPFGDHGWLQANLPYGFLPWSHLLLPKALTYKLAGKKIGRPFTDTIDWPFLALNQHTTADFKRMFVECGLNVVCIRHVEHDSLAGKVFDILRRVPGLSKYFTDGIYCILEKAPDQR
jgi:SAM-dependent methyltransferase